MDIDRVGVDIAKNIFHVHGVDRHGEVCWTGKYSRNKWLEAVSKRVPRGKSIGMEACSSSHHWGRELQKLGYQVKLIAAQFVKPYVKSNKNDRVDAEAICEAMSRPNMRFVGVKTVPQQDIQANHRIRSDLISQRTAKANQIRGLVAEYGVVAPIGIAQLRKAVPLWLEDAENGLTSMFRKQLNWLREDLCYLDERIQQLNEEIEKGVKDDPVATRLMQLRGVGPLIASALMVALGDGKSFRKGRDFAASLGLTPRQHSTGGRDRLLGISKRGNAYLRSLLVHGARAVLHHSTGKTDGLSKWLTELKSRKHNNIVSVALANKTARAAWAIVHNEVDYDPELISA